MKKFILGVLLMGTLFAPKVEASEPVTQEMVDYISPEEAVKREVTHTVYISDTSDEGIVHEILKSQVKQVMDGNYTLRTHPKRGDEWVVEPLPIKYVVNNKRTAGDLEDLTKKAGGTMVSLYWKAHGGSYYSPTISPEKADGSYAFTNDRAYAFTTHLKFNAKKDTAKTIEQESMFARSYSRALGNRSDYDRLLQMHNWLIRHTEYGESNDRRFARHDSASILNTGRGVCQAYTSMFYKMALIDGFEVQYVSGLDDGERHAWNSVYYAGRWRNIDVTHDDPIGWNGGYVYDNFLIPLSKFKRPRTVHANRPTFSTRY